MFPAGRDNLGTVRVVVELLPLLWVVVEDAAFVAFDARMCSLYDTHVSSSSYDRLFVVEDAAFVAFDSIDAFTLALFLVGFVQGLV